MDENKVEKIVKEKDKKGIIIIILIALFALIGVIVYNVFFKEKNDVKFSNSNETQVQLIKKNDDVSKQKIDNLLANYVNAYFLSTDYGIIGGDFSSDKAKIAYVLNNSASLNSENICGTDVEKELIERKVIVEKGTGENDCTVVSVYKADDILKSIKQFFGNDISVDLNELAIANPPVGIISYYYEEKKLVVFYTHGYENTMSVPKYEKHEINENMLDITFSVTNIKEKEKKLFKAEFEIVDDIFYLKKITELNN